MACCSWATTATVAFRNSALPTSVTTDAALFFFWADLNEGSRMLKASCSGMASCAELRGSGAAQRPCCGEKSAREVLFEKLTRRACPGCALRDLLRAQLHAADFPRDGFGQFGHKLDAPHPFIRRQLGA